MNSVVDRVPTRPGRVKITHSNGTVEYVTIERADEPTQAGTPLNKVLFDSIKADFETKQNKVVTGSFVASSTLQTINLGFKPRCVIINSGATSYMNYIAHETEMVTTEKPTYTYRNDKTKGITLSIIDNGFTFTNLGAYIMADGASYGTGYRYIAFA